MHLAHQTNVYEYDWVQQQYDNQPELSEMITESMTSRQWYASKYNYVELYHA